jgi:hypothetical protein
MLGDLVFIGPYALMMFVHQRWLNHGIPAHRMNNCRNDWTDQDLTIRWSQRRAGVISSFSMTPFPSRAATRALLLAAAYLFPVRRRFRTSYDG